MAVVAAGVHVSVCSVEPFGKGSVGIVGRFGQGQCIDVEPEAEFWAGCFAIDHGDRPCAAVEYFDPRSVLFARWGGGAAAFLPDLEQFRLGEVFVQTVAADQGAVDLGEVLTDGGRCLEFVKADLRASVEHAP